MTVYTPHFTDESAITAVVDSFFVVKAECRRAIAALRLGNHAKALRLMKNLCSKHENSEHSAFIHRVQATVCLKACEMADDTIAKQGHMQSAFESARMAVNLSHDSIEFALFYAILLFGAAKDAKDYDGVVCQCERALMVENPVDPAKQSLQDENQNKISVAHVKSELINLIRKSNMVIVMIWMENFENGNRNLC